MEKAVLVGVLRKDGGEAGDLSSLEELKRLTETAGGRAVAVVTQRLERFHPRSLIGPGKVEEVARAARAHGARTVIFDENLTPAQQLSLEKSLGAKVVDRTRLILDIFAQRARTKEGELQVELAQLSYMLPRLTGSWRAFSQQVGGIGTRGPGERKIEYERRHIQRRIAHLKRAIARVVQDREVQSRRRRAIPVPAVAIIGYTNAGKSSLLNRLTAGEAGVYADDKLFATLDPTTRRVRLPEGGWAVFSDTVGFISKLPTALVAAFRSTLEETARADCLLHLEDGGHPAPEAQRRVVDAVLEDLKASHIPRVHAVNKADLLDAGRRAELAAQDPRRVFVSARTGEGLGELLHRIQEELGSRWLLRELVLGPDAGRHLPEIHRSAQVLSQSAQDDRVVVRLRVTPENWSRLRHRVAGGGHSPGRMV